MGILPMIDGLEARATSQAWVGPPPRPARQQPRLVPPEDPLLSTGPRVQFAAMEQMAVLTSTAPLRKTTTRRGVTKQRLNLEACIELAERFDVIIIGSLSHDEVFDHIARNLPREARSRFRLYPRSFFHSFRTPDIMRTTDDPRNPGWERILSENGIAFEVLRSLLGEDNRYHQEKFDWRLLGSFITDERVTLVTGSEGQLFFEKPRAAAE
jgi:hypothetical protein